MEISFSTHQRSKVLNLAFLIIAEHFHVHNMIVTSFQLREPDNSHSFIKMDFYDSQTVM